MLCLKLSIDGSCEAVKMTGGALSSIFMSTHCTNFSLFPTVVVIIVIIICLRAAAAAAAAAAAPIMVSQLGQCGCGAHRMGSILSGRRASRSLARCSRSTSRPSKRRLFPQKGVSIGWSHQRSQGGLLPIGTALTGRCAHRRCRCPSRRRLLEVPVPLP